METENQSSFILPMPQDFPSGIADEDTVIPFIEDTVTPMTIDASAPGDVIELRDDFDFDGYQVVRREFLHTRSNRLLRSTTTRSMSTPRA